MSIRIGPKTVLEVQVCTALMMLCCAASYNIPKVVAGALVISTGQQRVLPEVQVSGFVPPPTGVFLFHGFENLGIAYKVLTSNLLLITMVAGGTKAQNSHVATLGLYHLEDLVCALKL